MGQPYQTDPLHNLKKIILFLLLFFRSPQYAKQSPQYFLHLLT